LLFEIYLLFVFCYLRFSFFKPLISQINTDLGWFDPHVISTGAQRSGEISGELVAGYWILVIWLLLFEIYLLFVF